MDLGLEKGWCDKGPEDNVSAYHEVRSDDFVATWYYLLDLYCQLGECCMSSLPSFSRYDRFCWFSMSVTRGVN